MWAYNTLKKQGRSLYYTIQLAGFSTRAAYAVHSVDNDEGEAILKKVISSHIAYKSCLIQLLDTYHLFRNVGSLDLIRRMRSQQNQDLERLYHILSTHRVPPPLAPFTQTSFALAGAATSFLDDTNINLLTAQLCRIVENHTDYCLFLLNEHKQPAQDVRKVIIEMRDSSYSLSEDILSNVQSQNACINNLADYIFQPLLRRHFQTIG